MYEHNNLNISAVNSQYVGIYFESCENTTIMNILAINNQWEGIHFYSCKKTTMINISVINNQYAGIDFSSCKNTTIMNISATNNEGVGMVFFSCNNTTMTNLSAIYSPLLCGCYVYSSGLYKREYCICTGSGLYLDTAQSTVYSTLSNLHTMVIDKMMSVHLLNCVNSLITT